VHEPRLCGGGAEIRRRALSNNPPSTRRTTWTFPSPDGT
jgi:hypothetical protein